MNDRIELNGKVYFVLLFQSTQGFMQDQAHNEDVIYKGTLTNLNEEATNIINSKKLMEYFSKRYQYVIIQEAQNND